MKVTIKMWWYRNCRIDSCYAMLILLYAAAVYAQSNDTRCFQFTWLGPSYNSLSVFENATCADATNLASGIPCQLPLVASYDGSWPDVDYIWRNHGLQASCILADTDVCAQYTHYYNGIAQNSTYLCTKAINRVGDTSIMGGCYEQRNGTFARRVCFCRSVAGGVPCNGAGSVRITTPYALLALLVTLLAEYLHPHIILQ